MVSTTHVFAIYSPQKDFIRATLGATISVADQVAYHRIVRVLRLSQNDTLILFDGHISATCIITAITKQAITCVVRDVDQVVAHEPEIVAALPYLKRDDLHDAINGLVQMGVSRIQLVTTKKSQQAFDTVRDQTRLDNVVIAAAEQSKNFCLPRVVAPLPLQQLFAQYKEYAYILFHPTGISCKKYFAHAVPVKRYLVLVGPEGDFDESEQQFIGHVGAISICLTPTILRAATAMQLGVGMLRSLVTHSDQ